MSSPTEGFKKTLILAPAAKYSDQEIGKYWLDEDNCNSKLRPVGFVTPSKLNTSKNDGGPHLKDLLLANNWERSKDLSKSAESTYKSIVEDNPSPVSSETANENIVVKFPSGEYFNLPKDLSDIAQTIEESKILLSLEENWDDQGGIPIPEHILLRAINLVVSYSKSVYETLSLTIESPMINPLPDGSIDLKWHTNNARLLLNVRNDDKKEAHYYGDFHNGLNATKGKISTAEVVEYFLYWMANLRN